MNWKAWIAVGFWAVASGVQAQPGADVVTREMALAAQLRCVVCQNQTVAESQAPMALDMRREIRSQLEQGLSDAEVVSFFEQRYGAFVRYSPPWKATTWLLWSAPFALLGVGLWGLRMTLKRRKPSVTVLSTAQRQQVQAWLEQPDEDGRA